MLLFVVGVDLLSVLVDRDLVFLSRVFRRLTRSTKYLRMEDPAGIVTRKGAPFFQVTSRRRGFFPPVFGANFNRAPLPWVQEDYRGSLPRRLVRRRHRRIRVLPRLLRSGAGRPHRRRPLPCGLQQEEGRS